MYKLKSINGRVNGLLKTGNDFVETNLSINAAQHITETGKMVESDRPGYPICIAHEWYFEGEEIKRDKKEK